MMHLRSVTLGFIAGMIAVHPGQCGAAVLTIDFGTENVDLPYSEGGLIFTAISGTGAIRGAPDAMLKMVPNCHPSITRANTPDVLPPMNLPGPNGS